MHVCPVEIAAILSMIPFFKYFVQPCCLKVLDKCHDHFKKHKHGVKDGYNKKKNKS